MSQFLLAISFRLIGALVGSGSNPTDPNPDVSQINPIDNGPGTLMHLPTVACDPSQGLNGFDYTNIKKLRYVEGDRVGATVLLNSQPFLSTFKESPWLTLQCYEGLGWILNNYSYEIQSRYRTLDLGQYYFFFTAPSKGACDLLMFSFNLPDGRSYCGLFMIGVDGGSTVSVGNASTSSSSSEFADGTSGEGGGGGSGGGGCSYSLRVVDSQLTFLVLGLFSLLLLLRRSGREERADS